MPPFEIVYDWMEYGRITEYVRKYPSADRINLVSEFLSVVAILFQRRGL